MLCTVYCTVDQRETIKKIPWKPKSTPDGFNFGHVPDISGSGGGGDGPKIRVSPGYDLPPVFR